VGETECQWVSIQGSRCITGHRGTIAATVTCPPLPGMAERFMREGGLPIPPLVAAFDPGMTYPVRGTLDFWTKGRKWSLTFQKQLVVPSAPGRASAPVRNNPKEESRSVGVTTRMGFAVTSEPSGASVATVPG